MRRRVVVKSTKRPVRPVPPLSIIIYATRDDVRTIKNNVNDPPSPRGNGRFKAKLYLSISQPRSPHGRAVAKRTPCRFVARTMRLLLGAILARYATQKPAYAAGSVGCTAPDR